MNLNDLFTLLGITAGDVGETAKDYLTWAHFGSVWQNAASAQSYFRSIGRAATLAEARRAFSIANWWAFQSQYLAMVDPNTLVPTSMMGRVHRTPKEEAFEATFRYDVQMTLHFKSGDVQSFWVHVDSPTQLSLSEIHTNAFEQLVLDFQYGRSRSAIEDDPYEQYSPEFTTVVPYKLMESR